MEDDPTTDATTTEVTYVGPPHRASRFAHELKSRGLVPRYDPPFETKDWGTAMDAVSLVFSVTGSVTDLVLAARVFMESSPGTRIDGLPQERRSISQRLAEVDDLHAAGAITDEERTVQRARILDTI